MPRTAHGQLYVAQDGIKTLSEYNATTGAPINANFITGLNSPEALLVAPVPEPSTWSLIAVGAVGLFGMTLRKNRIA